MTDEDFFSPGSWEERYAGEGRRWSGAANPPLVELVADLVPGTALDVGCGEGGDVVWLARRGWQVTGADFSANGLARAAQHAEEAGVAASCTWEQVDALSFDPADRAWDLVTTHFLHPPGGSMAAVVRRLAAAVAPGGTLLVVGHAPVGPMADSAVAQHRALWSAADLLPALPADLAPVLVADRPRTVTRDGQVLELADAVLLARRS